ncbi:MAG: hypothetical protein ACE5I7_03175 [Candidatus Binatia bacterium]
MKCILVTHTHWDREWYRTFQEFRARLVDVVDRVIELCREDPGYRFVLDGQSIVIEDYLEIRPQRREALTELVARGQLSVGPWYVQPDSLLPSGEAHIRNLLEGRRVAEPFGPASTTAYTPDSFGHPAQFPQLFRGFGLDAFVYWRGSGNEIQELPAEYLWAGPDGEPILACHLGLGYFNAAFLSDDPQDAGVRLERVARKLAERATSNTVLLMNGVDHHPPYPHTRAAAEVLAARTDFDVVRGVFEDFVRNIRRDLPRYRGELVGAKAANLLPGVWSTRTYLKLRNRTCQTALEAWAEPFAALGDALGLDDERPALRAAWRELLKNQAHDSLCGCSRDAVHEQMMARYAGVEQLARETTRRALERLSGMPLIRQGAWSDEVDIAVWNPSPHPRTDVVRFRIDPEPALRFDLLNLAHVALHPLLVRTFGDPGFTVGGEPARVVPSAEKGRYRMFENAPAIDVEFVASDVPAFGWKKVSLRPASPQADVVDDGREISAGDVSVAVAGAGTLTVRFGGNRWDGLCGIEDRGDAGDTYDFEPVDEGGCIVLERVTVERREHASGLKALRITRALRLPMGLSEDGKRRSSETTTLALETDVRLVPGIRRVDLVIRVHNTARDHRLRLLFPTGARSARAASTFDVAERRPGTPDGAGWRQPPVPTFPHQGWIAAGGLCVAAPGLAEGELLTDGAIAVTLLRSVGWLARLSLSTRPEPAGPTIPVPGAQCPGLLEACLWLLPGEDVRAVRDAELGLAAVLAGDAPLRAAGDAGLTLEPRALVLSALKPAQRGDGTIVRVLNPTDTGMVAELRMAIPFRTARAVRLDESPSQDTVERRGAMVRFSVPARALRSVELC